MRPSLFRNYILLSIFISVAVLFIGVASSSYVSHLQRERERLQQQPSNLIIFVAHTLGQLDSKEPAKAFETLKDSFTSANFVSFWLVNQQGNVLASSEPAPLSFSWSEVNLPEKIYDSEVIKTEHQKNLMKSNLWHLPFFMTGPVRMTPPMEITRLPGNTPYYLISEFKPRPNPNPGRETMIFQLALLLSIVMASMITFGLISWHVRTKGEMAEEVMSRMQNGDLKARFPVHRHDEIGRIMSLFNKMGDEIERLVAQIKKTEQSRIFILQELAHDLRTPIASLKSMLETLIDSGGKVSPKLGEELMEMSLEEVNYFARLVEDLLLLAQVLEPQYQSPFQKVDWTEILQDEVARFSLQQSASQHPKKVQFTLDSSLEETKILGDEGLLRRVFRNTLQNAIAFAKGNVMVKVQRENGHIQIIVQDDGPGFTKEILDNYGERRVSRYINSQEGAARLSVGLGSVIIKKVVLAHKGQVAIKNQTDSQGRVDGAEVKIQLPLA